MCYNFGMKERSLYRPRSLDDEISHWIFSQIHKHLKNKHTWENAVKMAITMTDTVEKANMIIALECGRLVRKENMSLDDAYCILFENWIQTCFKLKNNNN